MIIFELPVNTDDLLIVMIESKIKDLLGHGRNHFIWTQSNLDLLAHLCGSLKQDMSFIGICLVVH